MARKTAKKVSTYKEAGVDIDLATELLSRVKKKLSMAKRPEMLAPIGGFGGLAVVCLLVAVIWVVRHRRARS